MPDLGKDHRLSIEQAITSYIAYHHRMGHEAKTLEWHQIALGQFRKYFLVERHLLDVCQITEMDFRNWFVFLAQTPTKAGKHRAASTIETYARSVRAFCCWLVQRGDLPCSPLGEEEFPRTSVPFPHLIQPETFDRLVQAAFPQDAAPRAKKMAARDRALLWVLFDTGISVSEVCALCMSDLDRKTGTLHVRGKGGKKRQIVLGATCLGYLLGALDQACATQGTRAMRKSTGTDPLFCTERGRPLTKNSLALLFRRLRTRAGMDEIPISPKILRHSFALRYLQAGGNPQGLQELLGYEGTAPVRQYQRWYDQVLHDQMQKGTEEG
jgi:site-specific recombinase XerD